MRTRQEIENEAKELIKDYPSVETSILLSLILEVLLDIRGSEQKASEEI